MPDRAAAMAASLARALRGHGLGADQIGKVSRAYALAMQPRLEALDEEHPQFLHPGRTALILLRDAQVTDTMLLAAAAVTESEQPELRLPPEVVYSELGAAVAAVAREVPMPGDARLLERLLVAEPGVRVVALAERLDHLRHAHLLGRDEAWRRAIHAEALHSYLPVAERTSPQLERRYRHWCRVFVRRTQDG